MDGCTIGSGSAAGDSGGGDSDTACLTLFRVRGVCLLDDWESIGCGLSS